MFFFRCSTGHAVRLCKVQRAARSVRMSRKNNHPDLPPLAIAFPGFKGFSETDIKQQIVFDALRSAALHFRAQKSCKFYTMREVATFFSVPLRTAALAYEGLESEGLLARVRGSKTLLTGRASFPRKSIRGVIGLPIWMNTLRLSPFTQQLNMKLESHLRKCGFVADLIFHHLKREETHPDFAERLLQHHLDAVIWHNPHPGSLQNLITLTENAVRTIVILTPEAKIPPGSVVYLQDYSSGIHELARRWSEAGVQKAWIPLDLKKLASKNETALFEGIFREHGLRVEFCEADASKLLRATSAKRAANESAIAFIDIETADRFCNCDPRAMEHIKQFAKVALCRGPIRCPYLQHSGVQIELIGFSPEKISEKLAGDIQVLPDIVPGIRHTFKSEYWADISQSDMPELS